MTPREKERETEGDDDAHSWSRGLSWLRASARLHCTYVYYHHFARSLEKYYTQYKLGGQIIAMTSNNAYNRIARTFAI